MCRGSGILRHDLVAVDITIWITGPDDTVNRLTTGGWRVDSVA